MDNLYTELIDLLERHGASYRLIDHPPEQLPRIARKNPNGNTRGRVVRIKCHFLK